MSKYICDGHEYTVLDKSRTTADEFQIRNNYGTHVATLSRRMWDEYWFVTLAPSGDEIATAHENWIEDNLLESWAVQRYVAWAMDNDTVEDHS